MIRKVPFEKFAIVGFVPNTREPEPVSSVTAVIRFALDGVARNVATPVPKPLTPVDIGNPVRLVATPDAGVPSAGVVSVGDVIVGEVKRFATVMLFEVEADTSSI